MTDVLRHRGPDGGGFHQGPGIALGVRRLSSADPEGCDQPVYDESRWVVLICDGAILNAPELREELLAQGHAFRSSGDAEVLVHLYEDDGPGFVRRLRGAFAFALWDGRRRSLMLGRDRIGIKPLCYSVSRRGLCFGSELKSILLGGQCTAEIDALAVEDLFRFGYVRDPRTLLAGVRRLPPAHYLLYRGGRVSLRRYWQLLFPARGDHFGEMRGDEWAEALLEKLQEAIRLNLRSAASVGAWLSGGVDSSAVTALAGRSSGEPLDTYSVSFEERPHDEVSGRRTLANFDGYVRSNLKVPCRAADFALLPTAVWHCENISTSGIEIVQLLLARATSSQHRAVLSGEGADEVFGGYGWYRSDRVSRPLARLPVSVRRLMLMGPLVPRFFPRLSKLLLAPAEMNLERFRVLTVRERPAEAAPPFSAALTERMAASHPEDGEPLTPPSFPDWHPFSQLQFYEFAVRVPGMLAHMLDHDTMAFSVEARLPFLDHEVVEFCAGIPPSLKRKGRREKHILREAMRDLLPDEIVQRPKEALRAPRDQWLRGEMPEFASRMLSQRALADKGYFEPSGVLTSLKRHRAGQERCGGMLMACLVVQLWDEIFLSRRMVEEGP